MKVNNLTNKMNIGDVKSRTNDLDKAGLKNPESKEASASGSSSVNVSEKAHAFNKAKSIASEQSVDEAKVARLQKLIDEGNYKVDADAIADKLVDEHLMLN